MNQLIEDILSEMKLKHGVTKFELEKIIDSQFKVLQTSIQNKDLRQVYFKGLGKFKPTTFLIALKDGRVHKKNKRDIPRVEESHN